MTLYYTIYYGLRQYRYESGCSTTCKYKVARKLGIPIENIDDGVAGDFPMWTSDNKKHNWFLLLIGRTMLAYEVRKRRRVQ